LTAGTTIFSPLHHFGAATDENMEISTRLALPNDEISFTEILDEAEFENLVNDLVVQTFEEVDFLQKMGLCGFFSDGHQNPPEFGIKKRRRKDHPFGH
jgi:hypothetical protein